MTAEETVSNQGGGLSSASIVALALAVVCGFALIAIIVLATIGMMGWSEAIFGCIVATLAGLSCIGQALDWREVKSDGEPEE